MHVAVTMGDPAGIGPEICIKALKKIPRSISIVLIGDKRILDLYGKIPKRVKLIDLHNADPKKIKIGAVSAYAGKASLEYLEYAINLAKKGEVSAIATAPINKTAIKKAGCKFSGHTEILADRTGTKKYAMMFVSKPLRVILTTIHIPLSKVPKVLTRQKILDVIELASGYGARIAVAGLNPHAGEGGILGKEDDSIIRPAVLMAQKKGINVVGPIAPDVVFHQALKGKYDIVVAMYHDQGLIPLKLLSFKDSVNVTVGLPFIRTSVDHGTGFEIAGKGTADPGSLIRAIKMAARFSMI